MENVSPIPKEYETITPHIFVKNSSSAIEFYKKVFGAVEEHRHTIPGGRRCRKNSTCGDTDEIPG
ncbi:MAG: hypothetical protein L0H53_15200 [Candidatus Nitrosocosmicus sp.]|nr:hypothetical protein [Candidatus Nitrosocosmicus sp.]MDN5868747.1 hypothetical protein [Candidatus Nitrosocosmicus sp.]